LFFTGDRVLLMGSSKYRQETLPDEVREVIDTAILQDMVFIVAEAFGACRLYQDYLAQKNYRKVIVGHARSIRYNARDWSDHKYGDNLKERELNMIKDCDVAVVIWQDQSGVIAENLENLKKLRKLTYLYEYDRNQNRVRWGTLDPERVYKKQYYYR
jgi:hypothetical protein